MKSISEERIRHMEVRAAALLFGFFLDFLFGDPRWLCHPVRLIGSAISAAEKGIRSVFPQTPRGERAGGILSILPDRVRILRPSVFCFENTVRMEPGGRVSFGVFFLLSADGGKGVKR